MHRRTQVPVPVAMTIVLATLWVSAVIARAGGAPQAPAPVQPQEGILMPSTSRRQSSETGKQTADKATTDKSQLPAKGSKVAPPPAAAAGAELVGDDETCLTCHEAQKSGYSNTMHGRPDHPRSPASNGGCESCHGPGSKHVE